MSLVCADARIRVDVHGPCCHSGPNYCAWPAVPREVKLMSMVLTASEGLVWLCGLLQPGAMSVVCAGTGNHVLGRDLCFCWLRRARKLHLQ